MNDYTEVQMEHIKLELKSYTTEIIIDDHVLIKDNADITVQMDHIARCIRVQTKRWFLSRKLVDDYVYSHPKNLWNLLLYFCFGRNSWLTGKFIVMTEHRIVCKEVYGNISLPEKSPFVTIDKLKNGVSQAGPV